MTQLWLAKVATGRNTALTHAKESADNAQWSPDGRWRAFLTERDSGAVAPLVEKSDKPAADPKPAARQLWLVALSGGEACVRVSKNWRTF